MNPLLHLLYGLLLIVALAFVSGFGLYVFIRMKIDQENDWHAARRERELSKEWDKVLSGQITIERATATIRDASSASLNENPVRVKDISPGSASGPFATSATLGKNSGAAASIPQGRRQKSDASPSISEIRPITSTSPFPPVKNPQP